MPKNGRGEFHRLALHLKMHTTRISHIFRGSEDLTLEQASSLAGYFGFSALETEYFITLVGLERAGNEDLRKILQRQKNKLRDQSRQLAHRLPSDRVFSENEKAIFYSQWFYSGIRLLTSIEGQGTLDRISERFDLPRSRVKKALEFLTSTGLCVEDNGLYKMGPVKTHLEADHPMVTRLHGNWRLMGMQKHPRLSSHELAFTAPMSLCESDAPKIREILMQAIEQIIRIPANTNQPDKLSCLNIDWFDF